MSSLLQRAAGWLKLLLLLYGTPLYAQHEEHLEQLPEQEHARLENDEAEQERTARLNRQLDLNTANAEALHELGLLSSLQIAQLLAYRQLLGPLVSLYELQAVPGFGLPVIQTILPYVKAGNGLEPAYTFKDHLTLGKHTLLLRYASVIANGKGADAGSSPASGGQKQRYIGSADKLMLRYRYQFAPYVSWGAVMEKDAGEQFFRGAQKQGFDHYSGHMFLRRPGVLKVLALGDYTVNMGQGLIQWHGLSFGKSGNVMQVKRESETLRPYASAGEFYFFRGAGVTLSNGRIAWTAFLSWRSLDAADSSGSLTSSGYHRTAAEVAKRGAVQQYSAGAVCKWLFPQGHVAFNALTHRFSRPFIKDDAPYRLYGVEGQAFGNAGIDYAASWRNVHGFGEAAVSHTGGYALLQGLIVTLARGVDAAFVYRNESRGYQAFYANAFGENAAAGNEHGLYTALQIRCGRRWVIAAYADVFRFPWLKYRIDAPSQGYDAQVAVTFQPDKLTIINIRYHHQQHAGTDSVPVVERQVRCQLTMPVVAKTVAWKCRLQAGATAWLMHQQFDARWGQWRIGAGYTWYETTGKKAVFLAGQGFPADNSLARFSGTGWTAILLLQRRITSGLSVWCRWQYARDEQAVQVQMQYVL